MELPPAASFCAAAYSGRPGCRRRRGGYGCGVGGGLFRLILSSFPTRSFVITNPHPSFPLPLSSFPRKRESTPGLSAVRDKPGFWIPAYAGMTVEAPGIRPSSVIPAKAGIHTRPIDTPGQTGVLDSGLRRNDGGGGNSPIIRHSRESGNPNPAHRCAGTNRGSGFRPTPE